MCTNLGIGGLLGTDDVDAEAIRSSPSRLPRGLPVRQAGDGRGGRAGHRGRPRGRHPGGSVAPTRPGSGSTARSCPTFWIGWTYCSPTSRRHCGLAGVDRLDDAAGALAGRCPIVAITRGADGSVVADCRRALRVPAATRVHGGRHNGRGRQLCRRVPHGCGARLPGRAQRGARSTRRGRGGQSPGRPAPCLPGVPGRTGRLLD